jgi:hypothetical protein
MKKIVHLLFLLVGVLVVQHVSAEMTYSPTLPQFGGGNGQALGIVQFEKQQIDARAQRWSARRTKLLRRMQTA